MTHVAVTTTTRAGLSVTSKHSKKSGCQTNSTAPLTTFKRELQPPCDLLKLHTNTEARSKQGIHSKEAQGVHATTKKERKDIHRPAQITKTCHTSFPLIVSSHHRPLPCCHCPSTMRGEHLCRDRRPLGSHTHQASFTSWHSMSRAMWQLSATFANSQSCNKREILSPDPCDPMTCNASLHTLPSREPLENTLSSSDQASPSLSHSGLLWQRINLPFFTQLMDLKSIPTHCFFRQYDQGDERTLI